MGLTAVEERGILYNVTTECVNISQLKLYQVLLLYKLYISYLRTFVLIVYAHP